MKTVKERLSCVMGPHSTKKNPNIVQIFIVSCSLDTMTRPYSKRAIQMCSIHCIQ